MKTAVRLLLVVLAVPCLAIDCLPTVANPDYDPCWNNAPNCKSGVDGGPLQADAALDSAVDANLDAPPPLPDLLMPDLQMPDLKPMCTVATVAIACGAAAPICDVKAQTCRACTDSTDDSACMARSAALPHCNPTSHQCVGCVVIADCAGAANPICDSNSNTCRGCQTNAECPSAICNDDGSCTAAANITYVDNLNGTCPAGMHLGTKADPVCEVTDALAAIPFMSFIHVAGSTTPYKPVTISTAITVTIVGPGAAAVPTAKISGSNGPAVNLMVSAGTTAVTFDGMELHGDANNVSDAVDCNQTGGTGTLVIRRSLVDKGGAAGINSTKCAVTVTQSTVSGNLTTGISTSGGTVTITQSTVSGNLTTGISTNGGMLTLTQSTITANSSGGISLSNGTTYDVENNFIVSNPGPRGVAIDDTSTGRFAFNTVVGNGMINSNGGISCGLGNNKDIESSIIWLNNAKSGTQIAGNCTLVNVVTGVDSFMGASMSDPAFVNTTTVPYDLHLLKGNNANKACCVDKVTPMDGGGVLPLVDHDGTTRPIGAGWDIGAHEVE